MLSSLRRLLRGYSCGRGQGGGCHHSLTPPQKSRVIAALQRKGHVVGYLGVGINDAPPLHVADVGCVLAVAWRQVDHECQNASVTDEANLTFAGFLETPQPQER
jgi:hypothetical protein